MIIISLGFIVGSRLNLFTNEFINSFYGIIIFLLINISLATAFTMIIIALGKKFWKPIRNLIEAINKVSEGDFFEVAMKVRYTDDVQTSGLYDLLREGISFDIGRLYASTFQNGTANLFRTTAKSGNPAGLLSNIKKNEKVIKKGINTIMEFFNK